MFMQMKNLNINGSEYLRILMQVKHVRIFMQIKQYQNINGSKKYEKSHSSKKKKCMQIKNLNINASKKNIYIY